MTGKSDRELRQLSAKAYGIEVDYRMGSDAFYYDDEETGREQWCPQDRDGQAFRLAVSLDMKVRWHSELNQALVNSPISPEFVENGEDHNGDKNAATRMAITKCAAAIGEKMP